MLENIKLSFEEINNNTTTTITIAINKEVRTLDEALDMIRNYYNRNRSLEPAKPVGAPTPPAPPVPPPPTPPTPPPAGGPTPPPPTPPTLPAPPTPPAPPAPPTPPGAPTGGIDRQGLIDQINAKFETDPKYKDFMQIINIMKQATAPNEKTAINDFTDEEVQKLANLVL